MIEWQGCFLFWFGLVLDLFLFLFTFEVNNLLKVFNEKKVPLLMSS